MAFKMINVNINIIWWDFKAWNVGMWTWRVGTQPDDSMGFLRKSNGDLTWNFYGDLLEFEIDELKTPKILGILVMINIVWYTH